MNRYHINFFWSGEDECYVTDIPNLHEAQLPRRLGYGELERRDHVLAQDRTHRLVAGGSALPSVMRVIMGWASSHGWIAGILV